MRNFAGQLHALAGSKGDNGGKASRGHTDILKEAEREFATAWRAWLAKTDRDEETYKPLYGKPVDIGNESP